MCTQEHQVVGDWTDPITEEIDARIATLIVPDQDKIQGVNIVLILNSTTEEIWPQQ